MEGAELANGLARCTFQNWPRVRIIWECLIHSDYFIPGGCNQLLSVGREWEREGVVMDRWWLNPLMISTQRALGEARLVGVVESGSFLWVLRVRISSVSA